MIFFLNSIIFSPAHNFDTRGSGTIFFPQRSTRHLAFPFFSFPFGRSVDKRKQRDDDDASVGRCDGGLLGPSLLLCLLLLLLLLLRERENQLLEFRVSLVDQKTFVVQSTSGGTDL